MLERLGEMRKGRTERKKRQFEEEGLDPLFLEFSRSNPAMWLLFLQSTGYDKHQNLGFTSL